MFTGIIAHSGRFSGFRQGKSELTLDAPALAGRLAAGDSLSVDGVCLSLTAADGSRLSFNLSRETLERTTLGSLRLGKEVNLELPLTLAAPLGGHLVSGHVDFTSRLLRTLPKKPGKRMVFFLPREFRPFFIPKGSVAVNGVSLTVAALGPAAFEVEVIPITLEKSNLRALKAGDEANVECDMVGKYVYNWLTQTKK